MEMLNIPNLLTILRFVLIPIFIIAMGYNKPIIALFIFFIAGITDALDGYIARRFNQETTLGKILDPIADKALLVSSFIFIYNSDLNVKFPFWFVVIVISRDIFILLGSIVIYILKGKLDVEPSIFGKITTFFQIVSVLFMLVANIVYIPSQLINTIIYLTVIFTVISALTYLYSGLQQLYS